jgi:hypothetical protein
MNAWDRAAAIMAATVADIKAFLLIFADPNVDLGLVLVAVLFAQMRLLGAASRDPKRMLDLTTVLLTNGQVDPSKVIGVAICEICLWAFALLTIKGQMTMVWFNTTFFLGISAVLGKEYLDLKRAALELALGHALDPPEPKKPPADPPPGTVEVKTTVTPNP